MFLSSGGYKGYGLGMMVEVFCGILAGAQYSKYIRTWKVTDRVANLVHFVLPSCEIQKTHWFHFNMLQLVTKLVTQCAKSNLVVLSVK